MSNDKLEEAKAALEAGDISESDKLFIVAEDGELTKKQFAEVALARGEIAELQLRWKDAAEHYARAVQLDRSFEALIIAQRLALDMADYDFALLLGNEAKKVAIDVYKEGSQEHATSLNNLGSVYKKNGQFEKAESLYKESLNIQKKISKGDDPVLAIGFNNLAELYTSQGRYGEAKPYYEKSLEIDKKIFGSDHPETATDINNLGEVYEFHKKYDIAESHYQQALDIREKKLAKNHPAIANSLNSLAVLYQKWNKANEAGPLYVRAIEILESNFGSEHPDTQLVKGNYERFKKTPVLIAANSAGPPS